MTGSDAFLDLAPQHVLMAVMGAAVFLAYLAPRILFRRAAASSAALMLLGVVGFGFVPGMPGALDPTAAPLLWERITEIAVIIVLFATGLRIDNVRELRRWRPTVRLLLFAMPMTIAAVTVLGWAMAGMTLAGALMLGAVLAPTDPVLAGDVQVGPPLEGREHPVRFALTAEAGLNDGLAFPFVYLALILAAPQTEAAGAGTFWLTDWLLRDVLYRITVGVVVGAAVGWLLGKVLFSTWCGTAIERSGPGVLALGAVLLCYGVVELVEGYGFIGAFVAGLVCRRVQETHHFHKRLHAFSEAVEHALAALILFFLGSTLPALWPAVTWQNSLIAFGLILVIRPLVGWISLLGTDLTPGDRLIIGFFGVRGIGSVYYVSFATSHLEFINEAELWALVAYTVFASALLHGATSYLVDRYASSPKRAVG